MPLVGGVVLGCYAPRRVAIGAQASLTVVAIAATLAGRRCGFPGPPLVVLAMGIASAVSLWVGLRLGARRRARRAEQVTTGGSETGRDPGIGGVPPQ